jgi:hypothetical protein
MPARCPAALPGVLRPWLAAATHRAGLSGLDAAALATVGHRLLGVVMMAGLARDELARRRSAWRPAAGPLRRSPPCTRRPPADGIEAPVLTGGALAPTGTWGTAYGHERWPAAAAVASLPYDGSPPVLGKPDRSQPALIRARASGNEIPILRSQRICLVCSVNILPCATCIYP